VIDERPATARSGGGPAVTESQPVWRLAVAGGAPVMTNEWLANEVPVALVYNGITHVVMLATPCDLEDFALGFSLSEGIIDSADELRSCEVVEGCGGLELQIEISSRAFAGLKDQRRQLAGRTGCGLCGAESLEHAMRPVAPLTQRPLVRLPHVATALDALDAAQQIRNDTGATHAAAWVDADGQLQLCREDVGRHNALDKLIGAIRRQHLATAGGFVLISSRASYEMVQKAATVGIGFIAAISAPTALAIRLAQETDVTLLGFVRRQGHVVYACPHRLR